MAKKLPKRGLPPMHPGELLREEILSALDRPKTEIAKLLGVSRQTLYDILEEKQPVTPVMALRLGKLCGNVLISGSICRSATICSAPSRSSETRSTPFRHWKWRKNEACHPGAVSINRGPIPD
jgi:addiction module HigA family antidote